MEYKITTYKELEWYIINETEKESLLLLRDSLTNEQIAKYFLEKKMIDFEYCVQFNDKQSPWWDESYIQRVLNTRFLSDAMKKAPELGLKVVAHCEDLFLAGGGKINEGEVAEKLGIKGIPKAAEDCGTAREIALAAALEVPVHICHVSTATSTALIRDAKKRGVRVTAETAPHYFSLTEKELLRGDADYRMNPPLRTQNDVEAIIKGLQDGTIDAVATDHAPHTPEEKADFVNAPNGSVGMETSFSVGFTYLVKTGFLNLEQLIEKMSVNPAKILGINAGRLCKGAPADIALVDLDERWTVDENKLHGKSKNTPFKGKTLIGKIKKTILGGRVVFEDL